MVNAQQEHRRPFGTSSPKGRPAPVRFFPNLTFAVASDPAVITTGSRVLRIPLCEKAAGEAGHHPDGGGLDPHARRSLADFVPPHPAGAGERRPGPSGSDSHPPSSPTTKNQSGCCPRSHCCRSSRLTRFCGEDLSGAPADSQGVIYNILRQLAKVRRGSSPESEMPATPEFPATSELRKSGAFDFAGSGSNPVPAHFSPRSGEVR